MSMPEYMCMHFNIFQASPSLSTLHDTLNTRISQSTPPTKKQSPLARINRLTILLYILPEQLRHLRIDTHFTLFIPLSFHLDIATLEVHTIYCQSHNLFHPYTRI